MSEGTLMSSRSSKAIPYYLSLCLFTIISLTFTNHCDAETHTGKTETWLLPSPDIQLYIEGMDDKKGLGRIFVPAMTNAADEPFYAVFDGDNLVGEQNMGSSIFLSPGTYTVVFGTGAVEQRLRKEVTIDRGESVIIEPDWSALTIEVLDKQRNYHKQDLHVYQQETSESYGIVPAINPELGEHLQTWILKPGLYKIVKRGEDFHTYVNFATVYLEPGSYTPFTVVMDSLTGGFVGAGILSTSAQLSQRRSWKLYGALHGSVIFNAHNDASDKDYQIDLTTLVQVDNRLTYDKFPHYYLSNNLLELTAIKQEGESFDINQDRLQLKNTYVYYLLNWLGGYSRLEIITHLFPRYYRFDRNRQIIYRRLDGSEETRINDQIIVDPVLFPLELKEGIGINLTPLRSFIARLSIRTGLGYWQTYNNDVYRQDTNVDTLFRRTENSFPQGLESSLISNLALLTNLTLTTEVNVLFPFDQRARVVADLENFISLRLAKNVTIEHTLRLKRDPDPAIKHLLQEQFVSLRFSYFLF